MSNGQSNQSGNDPKPQDKPATEKSQASERAQTSDRVQQGKPDRRESIVHPSFVVEAGDRKNSGIITVDALKLRLRGRADRVNWKGHGGSTSKLPDIPGIRLEVHPMDLRVIQFDPLTDDKDLCERIEKIRASDDTIRPMESTKVKPWPTVEQKVSIHEMKTLLLELSRGVHATDPDAITFTIVKGEIAPVEFIAEMPGEELYDPWSNNPRKPKFKKDADAWEREMDEVRHV